MGDAGTALTSQAGVLGFLVKQNFDLSGWGDSHSPVPGCNAAVAVAVPVLALVLALPLSVLESSKKMALALTVTNLLVLAANPATNGSDFFQLFTSAMLGGGCAVAARPCE